MASTIPIYDQIANDIGCRRIDMVLHTIFARERDANRGDEKDYGRMIEEIEVRVKHRHAILLELEKFGNYAVLNEPLVRLKVSQQEDLEEIEYLIKRRQASLRRAGDKSRIMKKLMQFKY